MPANPEKSLWIEDTATQFNTLNRISKCGKLGQMGPYCPPWRQKSFPPPSFLVREAGAILPSREGNMAPFWQFETKWGHTALQGGQYSPILPPGRVAWPHFEMGPVCPPLLLPKMLIFYHYVLSVSLTLKITPEHSIFYKISIPKTLIF